MEVAQNRVVATFNFCPLALRFGLCQTVSMPKRIRRPKDVSQWAHQIVAESVKEDKPLPADEISRVMAAMGRHGGRIGGKRRLETMTAEQRTEAASHAARRRWAKRTGVDSR